VIIYFIKYTNIFEQLYYFYGIDGINITNLIIFTLFANLAQHITVITILPRLPFTHANLMTTDYISLALAQAQIIARHHGVLPRIRLDYISGGPQIEK